MHHDLVPCRLCAPGREVLQASQAPRRVGRKWDAASRCRGSPKPPWRVYDGPMTFRSPARWRRTPSRRVCVAAIVAVLAAIVGGTATAAAEDVRLAIQKTGTLAWELDVIRHHGLDRRAGLNIVTTELAAPEAGKIALRGG